MVKRARDFRLVPSKEINRVNIVTDDFAHLLSDPISRPFPQLRCYHDGMVGSQLLRRVLKTCAHQLASITQASL